MQSYLNLLSKVMRRGKDRGDRTGTGTRSIFGHIMRFNLADGFPLITTKRVHFRAVVHELLWMISGSTNIRPLQEAGVTIWDEWADKDGELGPVYGKQWRRWELHDGSTVDQLQDAIDDLKKNPTSRRIIVTAWNPTDTHKMALPPCPCFFQFYVADNKVSCLMYQRSADLFLGVPFDIAAYALLTHMVAQVTNLEVGELIITFGDAHIYHNHFEQVRLQMSRQPRHIPQIRLNPFIRHIDGFTYTDITLSGYDPHPPIKAKVAV